MSVEQSFWSVVAFGACALVLLYTYWMRRVDGTDPVKPLTDEDRDDALVEKMASEMGDIFRREAKKYPRKEEYFGMVVWETLAVHQGAALTNSYAWEGVPLSILEVARLSRIRDSVDALSRRHRRQCKEVNCHIDPHLNRLSAMYQAAFNEAAAAEKEEAEAEEAEEAKADG
jgi:hypothetical protein